MKLGLLCALCLVVSIRALREQRPSAPKAATGETATPRERIPAEEYSVYATVVKQLGAAGLADHPLISDQTSTFECGTACNGMLIGSCSGMRSETQTPAQAIDAVRKQLTFLKKETSADFESKNQKCASIQKLLPLSTPYYLFSQNRREELPNNWTHPDLLYFSRVGLDLQASQALVYVALFSGTDEKNSGGLYILFEKSGSGWKLDKVAHIWDLGR